MFCKATQMNSVDIRKQNKMFRNKILICFFTKCNDFVNYKQMNFIRKVTLEVCIQNAKNSFS
jgi:hypothetical protein